MVHFEECIIFPIWDQSTLDFSPCFFKLAFLLPFYGIFAIFSAYYLGSLRNFIPHHSNKLNGQQQSLISIRLFIIATLTVLPTIKEMFLFALDYSHNGILDKYLEYSELFIKTLSWFIHLNFVIYLKKTASHDYNIRGPTPLLFIWALTLLVNIFELRSVWITIDKDDDKEDMIQSETILIIKIYLILEVILNGSYLLSLIPNFKEENQYRKIYFRHVAGQQSFSNLHQEETYHESQSSSFFTNSTTSYTRFHSLEEEILQSTYLGIAKENSNCFSKLFFNWVSPLLKKGACGYLSHSSEDLFDLPVYLSTSNIVSKVDKFTTHSRNSLLKLFHTLYGCEFYAIGLLKLLADIMTFFGPILLNLLVSFIENKDDSSQNSVWLLNGYIYVIALFLTTLIGALSNVHFNMAIAELNLRVRTVLITSIFRKTIHSRKSNIDKFSTGEIINHMSTDTDKVVNFINSFHAFWSLPIQIIVTLYLLYQQIGLAFLGGLIFTILLIPINMFLSNKIGDLSSKMMKYKDERIKLISDILYGIKVMKFHCWESLFSKKVKNIRQKELSKLNGRKMLDAFCVFFWATTPIVVSILSFGTFVLMGNNLTATKVFTSLALFNMLISPLNSFPWVISGIVEAWVSYKRISKLMEAEETDPDKVYTSTASYFNNSESTNRSDSLYDFIFENANFEWDTDNSKFKLVNLDFKIKKGEFIGIIGEVGSGKSALLHAILGEMLNTSGRVYSDNCNLGVGVVVQDAFIQQGTVRMNVLFGKSFNPIKYNFVIEGCCLDQDLKEFEQEDKTLIGENGLTLSGGQKARLALARAIYQDNDIYLIDDIFAAVDFKVAKDIFYKCFMGLLKNRTRIVATHHLNLLKSADKIFLMSKGRIIKQGKPEEILPDLIKDTNLDSDVEYDSQSEDKNKKTDYKNEKDLKKIKDIKTEEHQFKGTIEMHVYNSYILAIGIFLTITILFSLLAMQTTRNISDLWLAHWISMSSNDTNNNNNLTLFWEINNTEKTIWKDNWANIYIGENIPFSQQLDPKIKYYLSIFVLIGLLNSVFTAMRAFLFAYGGIRAARKIHSMLIESILKGKLNFFETNSLGRIMNRCSSDISTIDDSLPFILNILLAQVFGLLGTLILTSYAIPWILVMFLPLLLICNNIQEYYRLTARQLRRLSSISLSPIYSHFSETIKGLTTIRAMRNIKRFMGENETYLEANQKAYYSTQIVSNWLNLRLQMIGITIITSVGLIGIIQHGSGISNPGLVGLAISYALIVTNSLSSFVTFLTETEKEMISVERVTEYIEEIEQESQTETLTDIPFNWPSQGCVKFSNVNLKYRDELPFVLKNLSFVVKPWEKIGIIGRTGSGKSSIFQALFRLVDNFEGEILIDGINIKDLSLTDLRSKLCIIPQDPLILSHASLKENIDPFGIHSDMEIERVIRKCHLTDICDEIGGINSELGDAGNSLSAGQKQLLCLARAIINNARILCIDEASSNIDFETDKFIQGVIRSSFIHSTIFCIAHRINTIINYDRIIVMKNGEMVEFNRPEILAINKESHFYQLSQGLF